MFEKFSAIFSSLPAGTTAGWGYLLIAGLFEIFWVYSLKMTNGYTHFWWTMATIPLALVSAGLLATAMRDLPMGTAYVVWTGIGAIGSVVMGIALFGEHASLARLICIGLILLGVIGLKLSHVDGP